jgi:rhodanese-related sulfurtransferase/DNA-binding transcriptional ArsR family regulator
LDDEGREAVVDRDAKTALYEQFARVGKALASGKRLELLDLLAQGERGVDALARAAGLGLTSASAHLQTLRQAGLVTTRRDGTRIHYSLAGEDVAGLYAALRSVAQAHLTDVEAARISYLGLPGTPGAADAVEEVTREDLLDRIRTGDTLVLDVRPAEEYAHGHIPGAVGIPLDQLTDRLGEIPPNTQVVAYCRGAYCVLAHDAVRLLTARGHRAARLSDGMLEWRLADLPVTTAA